MSALMDDPVLVTWYVLAAGFFFVGIWALCVWFQVRGLRGVAYVYLATSQGLLTLLLAIVRAGDAARIPPEMVTIGIRAVFPLTLLSIGVLIDLWAADHNDHRSLTTRAYEWFKRIAYERDHKEQGKWTKGIAKNNATRTVD